MADVVYQEEENNIILFCDKNNRVFQISMCELFLPSVNTSDCYKLRLCIMHRAIVIVITVFVCICFLLYF